MEKTPEMLALEYPQLKADLDLCERQLYEICKGERTGLTAMSVPPRPDNFDMQFSAAFDELRECRKEKAEQNSEAVYFLTDGTVKLAAPRHEKGYILVMSEEQAYVVEQAVELLARLKIGQFERITEMLLPVRGVEDYHTRRATANDALRLAANLVLGRDAYNHPNSMKDDVHCRAWDVYQMLRSTRCWHTNPNGGIAVCFDTPRSTMGEQLPFCSHFGE